jgi:hypothetical protein
MSEAASPAVPTATAAASLTLAERLAAAPDVVVVGSWFILTRAIVAIAAAAGAVHVKPGYYFQTLGGPGPSALLAPFVRWDAAFYIDLARNGYPPAREGPVFHAAFFPLYPLLIRALDTVVHDTVVAALLIAHACTFAGALLLCRLSRYVTPFSGRTAALLFLSSPGADFLAFPYSEALFCLLVTLAVLAVMSDHHLLAGGLGALASATRPTGIVVAVMLVVAAWQRRPSGRAAIGTLAGAAISCFGLVAFVLFCGAQYGDPLYFSHLQAEWGRHLSPLGPIHALTEFRFDPDYYVVTLAAIAGAAWMIRRSPAVLSSSAWFLLLVPLLTGSLKSMIRFQGANVPLLIGVSPALRGRTRAAVLLLSLGLLAYETYKYSNGFDHN